MQNNFNIFYDIIHRINQKSQNNNRLYNHTCYQLFQHLILKYIHYNSFQMLQNMFYTIYHKLNILHQYCHHNNHHNININCKIDI
ncbi:unnamed protein product [Paramecium sonneborni]|uniref:Uncharacterized protein n=1 Tax=Paramecium sonneborni TaxID=65129 RepID=A0A8S1KTW1_9CILI|nr:unnamed protein product [Paramecium sonneborni]